MRNQKKLENYQHLVRMMKLDKYKNEVSNLKDKLQELEVKQRDSQKKIDDCLSRIPNIPDESVPVGDESFNKEIKVEGNKKKIDFEPKEHFELGENLKLMSFDKASKISGSRFVIQSGLLAKLERAIANYMLDLHTSEFGYEEISVPILVKDQALFGTGTLPKFADDLLKLPMIIG